MKIFLIAFLCSAILLPLHVNSQVKNDSITCDTGRNKTMIDGDHCIDYSSISLGRFLQGKVPGLYVRNWTGTTIRRIVIGNQECTITRQLCSSIGGGEWNAHDWQSVN